MAQGEESWAVGEVNLEGDIPLVYKFMTELPSQTIIDKMPWLTVVSWKYDGSKNNGMPPQEINESMMKLEDGLEIIKGREELYFDVYYVTGNNLKEFVFYIADRDKFMSNFNEALDGHPQYPLEINFYEDKEWADLSQLQGRFKNAANKSSNSDAASSAGS